MTNLYGKLQDLYPTCPLLTEGRDNVGDGPRAVPRTLAIPARDNHRGLSLQAGGLNAIVGAGLCTGPNV